MEQRAVTNFKEKKWISRLILWWFFDPISFQRQIFNNYCIKGYFCLSEAIQKIMFMLPLQSATLMTAPLTLSKNQFIYNFFLPLKAQLFIIIFYIIRDKFIYRIILSPLVYMIYRIYDLNTPMKKVPKSIKAWSLNEYNLTSNQFTLYQIHFDLHCPNIHIISTHHQVIWSYCSSRITMIMIKNQSSADDTFNLNEYT